jgi:predicted transcriptional regulator
MPKTQRFPQGAVISRLLLDLFQTTARGMLLAGAADASCADVILLCAVHIGHADGRPMTAGKVAEYVGMARPTAVRRLQEMMDRGIVRHDARKRWTLQTLDSGRRELIDSVIVANSQHVLKAMTALSKMDGIDIAQRDRPPLKVGHGEAE